ncbi:hypothetical protein WJX75_005336 [Coccomyxa subellipsoidea]|uniref:Nucleic acid binding NABP domain-containing protein n=1 Tax=Coccomyxa subellipsoidea TaxID=248742 RepID=A0ABR2YYC3_9CHLO
MPASLHDAYLQAAMADAAVRTAANQHDQALAALGVHPANALHQSSAVPMQHGLGNAHNFGACLNDSLVAPALQSDYNDAGFLAAQQQAETQALHPFLPQHLGGLRPQLQQQPQQRRRGRRGGVRQHAYRNGQALANRPGGARSQGQPAQAQTAPQANDTAGDQQPGAAAISGGTGAPQPAAAYVPTSADLAASVHLAANGQLVHCASSLPPSAYFMQDPFLSGNSSLASTIYTPTGTQDMQGLIGQLSGATTATGPASPRLLTPMTTPRACEATTAALRELIYPSSEDSSQSSANDLLFSQDAAALLARASAGGSLGTSHSMLNLYNMRTSVADTLSRAASTNTVLPSRGGGVFGQLWDT